MNEIAKPIDPMADFQTKLRERVRSDIRDLLPEDAVSALVTKAVEEEFFKPRQVYTGYRHEDRPSWFVEEVTKAATPIIKAAVEKTIKDHPDAIERVIREYLDTNKLAVITTSALTDMLGSAIMSLQDTLRNGRL